MRNTILVMNRELYERRLVFVAALSLGLLGLASPLLPAMPTVSKSHSAQMVAAVGLILAPVFTLAVAVLAGSSVLGRDLTEKRLSFYFLKPISARAIWAGKIIAALVLSLGSALFVLLPAMLFASEGITQMMKGWVDLDFWKIIGLFVFGAVFGVAIGHQIGLVLRARSSWAALDVLALPLLGGILAAVVTPFFKARAFGVAGVTFLAVFAVFLISIYVAGAAGISRGRSEIKSVQKVSSIVLWSGTGIGVLLAILYTVWVRSASLDDLNASDIHAAAGDTIVIQGMSTGRIDYTPAFITNVTSGKSIRLGSDVAWILLSADGSIAAWSRRASVDSSLVQLIVGRTDGSQVRETDIFFQDQASESALSPDGSLFALVDGNGLVSIRNLQSGSQIAAFKVKLGWDGVIRFLANDRLRIYAERRPGGDIAIFEYDLRARALVEHPPTPKGTNLTSLSVSPDGEKYLVRVVEPGTAVGQAELRDVRSGALRAVIQRGEQFEMATFASDGRIIATSLAGDQASLNVFSADGVEERTIDVGKAKSIRLGGEISRNQFIAVASSTRDDQPAAAGDHQLSLVDIATGQIKRLDTKSQLMWPVAVWLRNRATQPRAPGSIATRLFYTRVSGNKHAMILFDPLTGEQKHVAGKG